MRRRAGPPSYRATVIAAALCLTAGASFRQPATSRILLPLNFRGSV
jgi:hypothetical protein